MKPMRKKSLVQASIRERHVLKPAFLKSFDVTFMEPRDIKRLAQKCAAVLKKNNIVNYVVRRPEKMSEKYSAFVWAYRGGKTYEIFYLHIATLKMPKPDQLDAFEKLTAKLEEVQQ